MSDEEKTIWVLRFATRLHQLSPEVSGSAAAKIAESAFDSVSTVAPQKAAAVYALKMAAIANGHAASEPDEAPSSQGTTGR